MKDEILIQSYNEIIEDDKLIRLTTLMTIFHSLIFVIYILYQTYFIFHQLSWKWNVTTIILEYIKSLVEHQNFLIIFVILIIILLIGYFLFPPIAEASIIYYLNSKDKKISNSVGKWILKFFPMFELHGILSFFSFLAFVIAISRFYVLWILFHPLVLIITILWLLLIIILSFLTPYVKFIITLEDKKLYPAFVESIKLALSNVGITAKYVLINYLLYIRFIINIILIIGIPLVIIYIFIKFNLLNSNIWNYIIIWTVIVLTLISAYINWIIEAFFITYWNKVYHKIREKQEN